jgi:hypothetical protein
VFGLLLLAFAAGLQLAVRGTPAWIAGPAILALNGVGLVLAGLFPLRQNSAGAVYDPTGVHSVNGTIFFLGIGLALAAISGRLRGDPRWRGLARYTLVTGVVLFASFFALGLLALRPGAPLHQWLGLLQRLVLAVWLPCIVVLGLVMWRAAGQPEPALPAGPQSSSS